MRKPRLLKEDAKYHVIARTQRGEMTFKARRFKALFMRVVKRAKSKYKFQLYNFCIMGNHIHFIIKPAKNNSLSRIMQWILSVFAVTFNKIMGYIGHVWYDRFKSVLISSMRQFINTFLYIMENPVKAAIVENPLDYAYNGVNFYARGVKDIFAPP